MPILTETTEIVCPAGKPGEDAIRINLDQILVDEVRQDEVATVTPAKAGELLAVFNRNWRDLDKLVKRLFSEVNSAEKALADRKAIVLIEIAPKMIKDLGLDSNKETREAIIQRDEEYRKLLDVRDEIAAVAEFLKGKQQSFYNAYQSVRKLIDGENYNFSNRSKNPELGGGGKPVITGFGKPRY